MAEPSMNARFRCAADTHARRFGDELVVLDLAAGAYFSLDDVGAEVWDGIVSGRSLAEITAALREVYDVDAEQLARDVRELVGQLVARGLVVAV
jgi:hypothetical protein